MPTGRLPTLMPADLRAIIDKEIARDGAISFARFMELALYCPNFGYYEQKEKTPGRSGDFHTSVSVGCLFGELLAARFAGWLGALPAKPRQLVEAGSHDGRLAGDILRSLRDTQPDILRSLAYWILEPSEVRRESQKETLREFSSTVRWFRSWDDVPPTGINGIIFSNELLDAMPVHRLGWDAGARKWFEWGVASFGKEFVWKRVQSPESKVQVGFQVSSFKFQGETATVLVPDLPAALLDVLPDGFTTEVCPAAVNWWRRAAVTLRSGKLLTFDYGLTVEEFFTPERKDGTLRAYHQHHQANELLARPGEQDLTAHVNFTAIREAGESAGLTTESFVTQAQFLTAIVERAAGEPAFREKLAAQSLKFQTLTHPEHLGRKFRVLVQSRRT